MGNEAYLRTNQALTFARLALASWEASSISTALDAMTMMRYHREHTLFHAYRATQSLIFEVSGRYSLAPGDGGTIEQMLSGVGDGEFFNPELNELVLQSGDRGSWLAGMLLAWRQLHAPPGAAAAVAEPLKAGALIASTGAGGGEWGLAEARVTIDMLSKLLDRYRESMREW